MDDPIMEARRQKSAALFNNRHFAECAQQLLTLSKGGVDLVTVRQVASASGLADSVIRPVVLRLVQAQVLERLPRLGGGRSAQYYRMLDVPTLTWVTLEPASSTVDGGQVRSI